MSSSDRQQLAPVPPRQPSDIEDAPEFLQPSETPPQPARLAFRLGRLGLQLALPVGVIALALASYNYMKATKPVASKRPVQETVFTVRSIPVDFASHQPYLTLYGNTVAGRELEIRSLVAGQVMKTGPQLKSGGQVAAGDMLVEIDPFDYRVAISEAAAQLAEAKAKLVETEASLAVEEGNLKSVQSQLELARRDLERAQPLAQRGAVSERTLDDRRLVSLQRQQAVTQSQNNLKVWQARRDQHKATIMRLETTLERAKRRLEETKLRAPFNAFVSDVGAQVGRMLSVNDRVAVLIDRDRIDARFSLTDGQFGRLAGGENGLIGRAVEVRWNAGREPLVYNATIERIDGRVAAESGGVQIYARITDPRRPVALRPGVFVEVRLPDTTFDRVAKVPSEAVYDGKSVYVIVAGRLQRRSISVIGTSDKDLLIEGNIAQGERVLATRLSRPGDGVRVKERSSDDA